MFIDSAELGDDTLTAHYRLDADQPFLAGHFPGRPMMPGVLIIEHMAQAANLLVGLRGAERSESKTQVLCTIDQAKFFRPLEPGQTLTTMVRAIKIFDSMGIIGAQSSTAGYEVARARFKFGTLPSDQDRTDR
ncbi:MAG: hypothetical protein H6707_05230 [Deltaproteobacteria bacterium]|nr:hypothetical protein [Deltaproteobacteria bacterium]